MLKRPLKHTVLIPSDKKTYRRYTAHTFLGEYGHF